MKEYKYILYLKENTLKSNSIVDLVFDSYLEDDFTIVCNNSIRFDFHFDDFNVKKTNCTYDSFFMAFVSTFLTRSERDKLIKKIRGDYNA